MDRRGNTDQKFRNNKSKKVQNPSSWGYFTVDKVKWSLRAITVCCILIPLLLVIVPNVENHTPLSIVVPPQVAGLMSNNGQGGNTGSNIGPSENGGNNGNNNASANALLAQIGVDPNKVQMPQFESFTYDSSTQVATLTVNVTNPLTDQSIDVNSFKVTLAYSNGTSFTLQLNQPISMSPNQIGLLSIPISSSDPQLLQNLVNAVSVGNGQSFDTSSLQVTNLTANINGVAVQIPNLSQLFNNGNNNTLNNNNNGNNNNGPVNNGPANNGPDNNGNGNGNNNNNNGT